MSLRKELDKGKLYLSSSEEEEEGNEQFGPRKDDVYARKQLEVESQSSPMNVDIKSDRG